MKAHSFAQLSDVVVADGLLLALFTAAAIDLGFHPPLNNRNYTIITSGLIRSDESNSMHFLQMLYCF